MVFQFEGKLDFPFADENYFIEFLFACDHSGAFRKSCENSKNKNKIN